MRRLIIVVVLLPFIISRPAFGGSTAVAAKSKSSPKKATAPRWSCDGRELRLADGKGKVVNTIPVGLCGGLDIFEKDLLHKVIQLGEFDDGAIGGVDAKGERALVCTYTRVPSREELEEWKKTSERTGEPIEYKPGCVASLEMYDARMNALWTVSDFVPAYGVWSSPGLDRIIYVESTERNENCYSVMDGAPPNCTETVVITDFEGREIERYGPYPYLFEFENDGLGIPHIGISPSRRFVVFRATTGEVDSHGERQGRKLIVVDLMEGVTQEIDWVKGWRAWKIGDDAIPLVFVNPPEGGGKWIPAQTAGQ